jgi:hypothetical protein
MSDISMMGITLPSEPCGLDLTCRTSGSESRQAASWKARLSIASWSAGEGVARTGVRVMPRKRSPMAK